ncbi:uncharacterized protein [Littorina saxatilis]|uniref:Uncharacterized protein n=1 Tax=Littorina saxatilis TaxID=31220 RepID=A0AAN9GMK8_9CAEN
MSQPRSPVAYAEGSRQSLNKKGDDASDRKKTQAQRLLEFEMWTNDKTLKDLEYSQRRTEKKQRRREHKKDAINRCWQKLYIPAVVGMVGGTFLTLCGTLQSLGGDTVFWTVRTALTVLGPALLGLGFLCLMLAAGCTFKHDQHMRQKPKRPPCEFQFLLDSSLQFQDRYSRGRQAWKSETVSVDTEDLPVPADLDPQGNFVPNKAWVATHRKGSASSSAFLLSFGNKNNNHNHNNNSHNHNNNSHNHNNNSHNHNNNSHNHNTNIIINNDSSLNSTASWVHSVSASHRQSLAVLTRQNSDSNLRSSSELCSCGECHFTGHDSFVADSSELHDQSGSQSEVHVACTRSLTSSGYQSAGDSPTSVADYRIFVPRESSTVAAKFTVGPSCASSRHNVRHLSASAAVSKNLFNSPRRPNLRRGSLDWGTRQPKEA